MARSRHVRSHCGLLKAVRSFPGGNLFEFFCSFFANVQYVARWSGDAQEGGPDCKVTRDAEQHSEEVDAIEKRQDKE
jgi:hypothetical protein